MIGTLKKPPLPPLQQPPLQQPHLLLPQHQLQQPPLARLRQQNDYQTIHVLLIIP